MIEQQKEQFVLDRDALPEALSPQHIQDILGLSRKATYELMNSNNPPFRILKVGNRFKISKKVFLEWFDGSYPKKKPGRRPARMGLDGETDIEFVAKALLELIDKYNKHNRW